VPPTSAPKRRSAPSKWVRRAARRLGGPGALAAALGLAGEPARAQTAPPNFLVLVGDDLGAETIGRYGERPGPSHTPQIDALAASGVLFRNAWSSPLCSPSRAALLTGRHGFRTGVGSNVHPGLPPGLGSEELTLPELLGPRYQSAAFGKWHVGAAVADGVREDHPRASGFGHFAGTLGNLVDGQEYTSWTKTVDGTTLPERVTGYATSVVVDDALAWISGRREPWLVWIGFHATHAPLHAPPPDLHSVRLPGPPKLFPREHHAAMLEALDREIGRLLASLSPETRARTTVVFAGDNGTDGNTAAPPLLPTRVKGTVYEGGIHVPLIVASPLTPPALRGEESRALVGLVDVFATVAAIAGFPPGSTDSVSLLPYLQDPARPSLRASAYTELFSPNGPGPYSRRAQAVRNARYKLIRHDCTREELYDLATDPLELRELIRRRAVGPGEELALQELRSALPPYDCDEDGDGRSDIEDDCLGLANPDQLDVDRDGFGNACDADYDDSGFVGGEDFQTLMRTFGASAEDARYRAEVDVDGDGRIGGRDHNFFWRRFGLPPGPSGLACAGSVPCPAP